MRGGFFRPEGDCGNDQAPKRGTQQAAQQSRDGHGSLLRRVREWALDNAHLVTLGAVLAVIAASAMYTRQIERRTGEVQAAAQAAELAASPAAQAVTPLPELAASASPLPTIAPLTLNLQAVRPGGATVWPVSGDVLRGFDGDTPVLWEALSCVRVHAALDIGGEAGEDVLCVMDGTVSRVVRDELWGWRAEVEQTDGSQAAYCGLALCTVSPEQNVTRGQTLGTLMESIPCEAELGPHLHLELTRDGKKENPLELLPQKKGAAKTDI